MKKNLKITLFSGLLLSMAISIGCIPVAFQGIPGFKESPSPNPRTNLCNLLLSVGGTDTDVQACLSATTIAKADIDRLCSLSANLTVDQKETLRAGLTNQGVDVANVCPVFASPVPSPTPTISQAP